MRKITSMIFDGKPVTHFGIDGGTAYDGGGSDSNFWIEYTVTGGEIKKHNFADTDDATVLKEFLINGPDKYKFDGNMKVYRKNILEDFGVMDRTFSIYYGCNIDILDLSEFEANCSLSYTFNGIPFRDENSRIIFGPNVIVSSCTNPFTNMKNLSTLDISVLDFSKCTSFGTAGFISSNSQLKEININGFNSPTLENPISFFARNQLLQKIEITDINVGNIGNFSNMLNSCSSLTLIDLSGLTFKSSLYVNRTAALTGCTSVITAYAKTQADCDILNDSRSGKPSTWNFVVKEQAAQMLNALNIQPTETNEGNIEALHTINVEGGVA